MYFRQRAEKENVESYQTTMNRVLRAEMERETAEKDSKSEPIVEVLTKNRKFIRAVAEQVKEFIAA